MSTLSLSDALIAEVSSPSEGVTRFAKRYESSSMRAASAISYTVPGSAAVSPSAVFATLIGFAVSPASGCAPVLRAFISAASALPVGT